MDSVLKKLFAGQPGVQYFDDKAQANAWLQSGAPQQQAGVGPQVQPTSPQFPQQPQQPPMFGGMAGWFQNWGRQGQGLPPLAQLTGAQQVMGQPQAPAAFPTPGPNSNFNALQMPNGFQPNYGGGGGGRFENHLFGRAF